MDQWVLGGTSGIGLAIVEELVARRGRATLVLSEAVDAGAALAARWGKSVAFAPCDLRELDAIPGTVGQLLERYGVPQAVFCSPGVTRTLRAVETDLAEWQRLMAVNLLGPALFCNAVAQAWLAHLEPEWRRHLVILGSVNALRPLPAQGAYSVAKAGLHAYAACLANDLAPARARVTVVAPGAIWTPMNAALLNGDRDGAAAQAVVQGSILGRWGEPDEIARVAVWAALDAPPFLNGSTLVVDGGTMVLR